MCRLKGGALNPTYCVAQFGEAQFGVLVDVFADTAQNCRACTHRPHTQGTGPMVERL